VQREAFCDALNALKSFSAGAPPPTPLGALVRWEGDTPYPFPFLAPSTCSRLCLGAYLSAPISAPPGLSSPRILGCQLKHYRKSTTNFPVSLRWTVYVLHCP